MDLKSVKPRGGGSLGRAARKTWLAASCIALVGLIGLLLLLLVPKAFGYRTLVVRSGSMTGTYDMGSLVVARPVMAEDVRTGDVILMQRESDGVLLAPVLHRVIEREIYSGGRIVVRTKGDANSRPDPEPYVLSGETASPAIAIPFAGFAVATLQTPVGWFGLVQFPAVLLTAGWLRRVWSSDGREEHPVASPTPPPPPPPRPLPAGAVPGS